MMKLLLIFCVLLSMNSAEAGPRFHRRRLPKPTPYSLTWKQIAAGGATAGAVVAAYKISDGVEEGMKTVAREKPEVFSGILTPFAWPLHVITVAGLVYAGYRIWRKYRNKPQTTSQEERNL